MGVEEGSAAAQRFDGFEEVVAAPLESDLASATWTWPTYQPPVVTVSI